MCGIGLIGSGVEIECEECRHPVAEPSNAAARGDDAGRCPWKNDLALEPRVHFNHDVNNVGEEGVGTCHAIGLKHFAQCLARRGPDSMGLVRIQITPAQRDSKCREQSSPCDPLSNFGLGFGIPEVKLSLFRNQTEKACLSHPQKVSESGYSSLRESLEWQHECERAMDLIGSEIEGEDTPGLILIGSSLQLRGSKDICQPLMDEFGNVLLFNGEIFGGLEIKPDENDAEVLLHSLKQCSGAEGNCIPSLLSKLRGPWSLIYWQVSERKLWYGKDIFGRRSLLIHRPSKADPRLLFSSVSPNLFSENSKSISSHTNRTSNSIVNEMEQVFDFWEEVPCGIFSISFQNKSKMVVNSGDCYDSSEEEVTKLYDLKQNEIEMEKKIQKRYCVVGYHRKHEWNNALLIELLEYDRPKMHSSFLTQTLNSNSSSDFLNSVEGEGFEGSVVKWMRKNNIDDSDERFNNFRTSTLMCSDDSEENIEASTESVRKTTDSEKLLFQKRNMSNEEIHFALEKLYTNRVIQALLKSIQKRTLNIKCTETEKTSSSSSCKVAILFSGGLDSMILAILTDMILPKQDEIELVNVSFDEDNAPDRQTAILGLKELKSVSKRK